ncbi:hypothetical protein M8J76_002931 [Diaphorina citri]|nr:hypothetical protein M8J76_002931 [Diaphorina citri]
MVGVRAKPWSYGTYQLINRLQDMVQNIKVKNSRISENISPEKVKNSPQVSALPTGVDHNGDLIDLEINNEDPLINIRSEAEPDTPELSIHILDQENISEKSEDVPHASSEIGFIPVSTSTVHVMPSPASIDPVTTVTTTPISRPISQNSPVNRSTNIPTLPPDVSSDVRNLLEQTDLLLSSRTFLPTSSVPNTSRNIPVTFVPTPMSSSLLRPISRPSSTMSQCGADIPIPGMEVKEEDIKGEQFSKPVESDLGRMSRNSNVSCMSSEQLSLVGQLLDRYNRDIENTAHVLRKAQFMQLANIQHLSDNERKLAEIGSRLSSSDEYKSGKSYVRSSKLNRSNDCKISSDGRFDHAVEIQEKICNTEVRDAFINEPSTSEPLLLNNESKLCNMQRNLKSNDGRDNCLVTQVGEQNTLSIKSSGHIVNRLKFPSHRDVKNTNDQSNNEFKMRNTDHKAYLEHGTGMDHKNVEYGTHIDYKVQSDYQRSTTNVLLGDRKTSSLDKSLNENLLVSSSDSSLMGSKVPPVSKKSKSRNVVKANFTTIISSLQTDEREKQKRIQEYVEATLQQAKENGSLDNTKHIDRSFETQDKVSTMEAKPSNLLNFEENERLAPEKLPHENEHHVPESKIITQDNKTNVPSDAIANKSSLDSKVNEEKLVDLIVNEEMSPDTKEICVPDMNDNDSNINTGNSRESKVTESTSLEAKPDKVRLQEVSVKKKKSSRGRPRKFHSNHPGPSLKTLAQNKNIFECLTNSADVSSEDTSTSAPKPRTRISTPNATLPETSNIPDTTSATNIVPNGPCETKHNTDSSGPRKKCRDGSPNRIKGPSASGESAEKTQKWFWRTLKQETLLQSKASKTIRIRVTHIPAIGEFYCQTLGVFPDYELGFKNLFFKCNSPQVFSEFQPVAFIRPGKLVMTCDPKSNKWYRSVVQAKVEGQDLFKLHNIAVCPNRDFIVSQDYVKYLRVWSSMLQIGQTYQAKIMSVKSLVEVSMEDSEGFDLGQLLALQCCTPYVELKSDNLPGAWSEFMTHP